MSVTIVRTLPEPAWRQFVEDHPAGNIFNTPEMFQVFSRAKGHHPELWAATEGNRVLALLLPVRVTLMNGLLRYLTTRSIAYGSVLCTLDADGQEALAMLLHAYAVETRRDVLLTELRHRTDPSAIQSVLKFSKYRFEEELNFLVNLTLPENLVWSNISKSARKSIRHIQEQGDFAVEELQSRQDLPTWYDLIKKTFAHAQTPLADYSLFESAFDILRPRRMVQFLLGRVQDHYVAASVALLYKNTIYGWYRGFDRKYDKYFPNDVMVWHVLKWGTGNGYRVFDFGGAGSPHVDYGPRKFKSKFGGSLVNYGRSIYIHAPIRLKISQLGYQILRGYFRGAPSLKGSDGE